MTRTVDAFDPVRKRLMVTSKRCGECLFSNAKIVGDARRDSLIAACKRDGAYFICHKHRAVICRGFFDTVPNQACRFAERLGLVEFTDLEPKEIP